MKTPYDTIEELKPALLADLTRLAPDVDRSLVLRALEFAEEAHKGQTRASGAAYVTHPIQVTRIVLDLLRRRADGEILAASLLHDVVEDAQKIHLSDLEKEFGPIVAQLVDGVTKIGGLALSRRGIRAIRELPQDAPLDGAGHPRPDDQAGRSGAQHADARVPQGGPAPRADRPRNEGDLCPPRAPARHREVQVGARGPRLQAPESGRLPIASRRRSPRSGRSGRRRSRRSGSRSPRD